MGMKRGVFVLAAALPLAGCSGAGDLAGFCGLHPLEGSLEPVAARSFYAHPSLRERDAAAWARAQHARGFAFVETHVDGRLVRLAVEDGELHVAPIARSSADYRLEIEKLDYREGGFRRWLGITEWRAIYRLVDGRTGAAIASFGDGQVVDRSPAAKRVEWRDCRRADERERLRAAIVPVGA